MTVRAALVALVLAVPLGAAQFKTVYKFQGDVDGKKPFGSLIAVGGVLYGTTSSGGTGHKGTVFKFDPASGTKTILYNVKGENKIGYDPGAPLALNGADLLTSDEEGGSLRCMFGCGTVFSVDPAAQTGTLVYQFLGGDDGEAPNPGLVAVRGGYYGTTLFGGGTNCNFGLGCGVVFKVDAQTGTEKVVLAFDGKKDGYEPVVGLTKVGDSLYGTTWLGPKKGLGTVFKLDLGTRKETVLHSFVGGSDGAGPDAALLYAGGMLYGVTQWGGNGASECEPVGGTGCGTVFSVDPATGAEKALYVFQGFDDGADPQALTYKDGILYGMTAEGGGRDGNGCFENYGCGTIYSLNVATGVETVLFRFQQNGTGHSPYSGLTLVNGAYYGVTSGFSGGNGTIFRFKP